MNKRKIVVPALLSILGCTAVIAGSTYALFTSEAKVNVAITSGKVDVLATVDGDLALSHKEWDSDNGVYKDAEGLYSGTATLDQDAQTITISNMLPMDKIAFKIKLENKSNVVIQYRTIVKALEDDGLFDGLIVTIDGEEFDGIEAKSNYETWAEEGNETIDVTIEMPEDASNAYQDKTCTLSYAVEAVQGNALTDLHVTKDNIQDYIDGKYGSINGKTIILEAGEYDTIELGRATKYEGSNTEYRIDGFDAEKLTYDAFSTKMSGSSFVGFAYYSRSISDVTFKAAEGADVKVAGISSSTGQVYDSGYDYVLDKTVTDGTNTYFVSNVLSNIAFKGITFTTKTDINTSIVQTKINGVVFNNCTFDINNTASGNQAIRFYNENPNGNLRNLTVNNCEFNNCYQGVFTSNIYGVTVNKSSFDTTAHNAIAVQDGGGAPVDHGKVKITNNTFANIGDRIMRFNAVGADTQIIIKNNVATNSGDDDGQVIKASSLADGIKYDISNNDWGEGKTVYNSEFNDK